MYRRPLLLIACAFFSISAFSQAIDSIKNRTYDGSYNNLSNPDWGAVGSNLLRLAPADYSDGMAAPNGVNRPNPRTVSNALFAQEGLLNDPLNLSDYCWVFGQFIDHDLGLTPDGSESINIQIPAGDQWFDPIGLGNAVIEMHRNLFDPNTGTTVDNPREHPNIITTFLDGSMVYGSDEERAHWLRSFEGGKLKVSQGNLLPFNTITGEYDAEIDPAAPEMDDAVGFAPKHFVAGDVRANENPLLIAFHTLFVLEHNRQCDLIIEAHPEWTDEQIYQHARKLVGGIIQAIVYEEWLPTMGVELPAYQGYFPSVNPGLFNTFTAAAFRLGHTLLNSNIRRFNNDGEMIPEGNLTLLETFFNPLIVVESGGIDVFFKGMATQPQQSFDAKLIDDVRNFLFGPPGAGGTDLASININRGRERGIPDFNSLRAAVGLQPYTFFSQFNSNAQVFTRLLSTYTNVNEVDAWVGLLAEEPMPDALFGPTIMEIMKRQFQALRDGDRFYYENDPLLSEEDKAFIRKVRLHDIIMKNTGITLMQDEVFKAMPHEEICDNMTVAITGNVRLENGEAVSDANFQLTVNSDYQEALSNISGVFNFNNVPACYADTLRVFKRGSVNNGVSTFDIILIQKHILGLEGLDSPYKLIAADADNNGSVSVLDLIRIRKVVLTLENEFPNNASWRFIPANYEFNDPTNPFAEAFPEYLTFDLLSLDVEQDFIAIKIGDVNNSANPVLDDELLELDERNEEPNWDIYVQDMEVAAGQTYAIAFNAQELNELQGFQFALQYDKDALQVNKYTSLLPGISEGNFGSVPNDGRFFASWNTNNQIEDTEGNVVTIEFTTKKSGRLSSFMQLDDRVLAGEMYNQDLEIRPVRLTFQNGETGLIADGFKLYQNEPNPVVALTQIPFYLPAETVVQIDITDSKGRLIWTQEGTYGKGEQRINLNAGLFPAAGVYYYQVKTDFGSAQRKLVVTE